MKLLHTADWHLGKIVNEFSMLDDQRYFLETLIEKIKLLELDLIIIAGDLYDRSLPSKEAVALADDILTRLIKEVKVPVFVIAGNHDSNERIEYGSQLFTQNGLYMEGTVKPITNKVTINGVNFYLVPFADPAQVREIVGNPDIRTMEDISHHQINAIKETLNPDELNVYIGHGYVINGQPQSIEASDSERPLTIGTAEYVPVELFECFDYVALGHIHKPQKIKYEHIRYSGSILKYSKSEVFHKKQMSIVDLEKGRVSVSPLYIEAKRDMRVIRGYFDDIISGQSDDYIFFELEDNQLISDTMNRLRQRYPYAMGLEYLHQRDNNHSKLSHTQDDLKQLAYPELFEAFYEEHTETNLTEHEKKIIKQAFHAAERSLS